MTQEIGRAALQRSLRFPLVLLALLAGLLAMYGLGPHDEDHSVGHAPSFVALASLDGRHQQEAPAATGAAPAADPGASNDSSPNSDGGLGLGGCLALLGLLITLAISAMIARRRAHPRFVLRRVRERAVLLGRPPDPPCLHRLSILRC